MTCKSKLFIANLSAKIDKDELEQIFNKFGKILDVQIREGRESDNFAFVEFEHDGDAEEALDKMQGSEQLGRRVKIEYATGGRRNNPSFRDDRDRDRDRDHGSSMKKNSECFICNKKGHWASECPEGAGQGIRKGTCFVCGSTRHKMRDCPKKDSKSRSRGRSGSRSPPRYRSDRRRGGRSGSRDRDERRRSRDRYQDRRDGSRDRYSRNERDRGDRRRRSRSGSEKRRDRRHDSRDRGGRRDDSRNRSRSRGSS